MSMTAADSIAGIAMPDTEPVRETTACIWVTEDDVPSAHLPRVLLFGALPGRRRGLPPDRELLHSEAMYLGPLLVRDDFVAVIRNKRGPPAMQSDGTNLSLLRRRLPAPNGPEPTPPSASRVRICGLLVALHVAAMTHARRN
jgi:hypothetical protein